FLSLSVVLPALHSFPTRRSSDLDPPRAIVVDHQSAADHAGVYPAVRPGDAGIARGTASPAFLSLQSPRLDVFRQRPRLHWKCAQDRKSTRLNSSHVKISYAVFCL